MKYLAVLGAIAAFLLLIALEVVLSGYAISVLWVWFVVDTFNIAALSIPQCIGLALLVSYMTKQYQNDKQEGTATEQLIKAVFILLFKTAFALTVGWVVTLFM
jgi:hypothetical protein